MKRLALALLMVARRRRCRCSPPGRRLRRACPRRCAAPGPAGPARHPRRCCTSRARRGAAAGGRAGAAGALPDGARPGGWTLGVGAGAEAPRVMLRRPRMRSTSPNGCQAARRPAAWRDAGDALVALPGAGGGQRAAAWRRARLPQHARAAGGACQAGPPASCLAVLVSEADVSGDQKLSIAEVARLLRGAAWALALQQGSEPEVIAVTTGLGSMGRWRRRGWWSPAWITTMTDSSRRRNWRGTAWRSPGAGSPDGQPGTIEGLPKAGCCAT